MHTALLLANPAQANPYIALLIDGLKDAGVDASLYSDPGPDGLPAVARSTDLLHLHGHTFALPTGLRKDTVLLAPMQSMALELDADNVGDWMVHCHNIYHAEAGMMIGLLYRG